MNEKTTLYYDGFCNFCNTWVRIIRKADRKKSIIFIPLQSEKGMLARKNIGSDGEISDTVIYEKEGNSDAVIQCLTDVSGIWRIIVLFKWIPKSIRDLIYKTIARNRYRIFGKTDSCSINS